LLELKLLLTCITSHR